MKSLKIFAWDTILLVVCILVIITTVIAVYWLLYLVGYGSRSTGVFEAGFVFLVGAAITLVAIVTMLGSAIRYFLRKEINLGLSRIGFCLTLVLTWMAPLTVLHSDPFAQGFHSKVTQTIDVEELLRWADEQFRLQRGDDTRRLITVHYDQEGKPIIYPAGSLTRQPPDSLKEFDPYYSLYFYTDDEGKQIMDIIFGGGFGHWGLRIGSSNLNQYDRTTDGTVIEWQPRLWVLGLDGG